MIDVMAELRGIGARFKAGELLTGGLKELADLWERIPEPKTAAANAYMVVEYGVTFALKLGDINEAKKWASLAPLFVEKRQDRGEVEFLVGKVAFESGDSETAKKNFLIANRKSQGRIFQGQDRKYRALIQ